MIVFLKIMVVGLFVLVSLKLLGLNIVLVVGGDFSGVGSLVFVRV